MVEEKWATVLLRNLYYLFIKNFFFTFILLKSNLSFKINLNDLVIYDSPYMIQACSFEFLKCFILLLWYLYFALYLVATYIYYPVSITKWCFSLAKTGSYIFILPWKCLVPWLAHNICIYYFVIPLLCLWEEHHCIVESPGTKQE